jgi:membrane protease YdiL (CAAX protease family)
MTEAEPIGGQDNAQSKLFAWRHVALAIAVLAAILAVAMAGGAVAASAFDRVTGADLPGAFAAGELEALTTGRIAVALLAFQAINLVGAIAAIWAFRRARPAPLAPFAAPAGGARATALHAVFLICAAAAFSTIVYVIDRNAIVGDVKPFVGMIRSDGWPLLALAAVVGAPLAEELTFRGFFYGVLAASPAGPTVAIIASSALWAALHASYSAYGLAAIFLIGLYLGWLRQKTGSLWPPVICHAVYNAAIAVALAAAPDKALQFGAL